MVYLGGIVSGILAQLLFAPYGWGWLAPVVLVPVLWSYFKYQKIRSILVFALILMAGFHTWVFSLTSFASLGAIWVIFGVLSVYYASFYVIGFSGFKRSSTSNPLSSLSPWSPLHLATLWTLIEVIKSWGPFGNPGANIAYSQGGIPMMAKLAAVGGVPLITFVLVLINASIAYMIFKPKLWRTGALYLSVSVVGIFVIWMIPLKSTYIQSIPIHIIQNNHSQTDKLNPSKHPKLLSDYLSKIQVQSNDTLIIAPETIVPNLMSNHPKLSQAISEWTKENHSSILFGALSKNRSDYFNSVYVAQSGQVNAIYHKKRLMPFGEYLPFRGIFKLLDIHHQDLDINDFSRGSTNQELYAYKNINVGLGICLESVYEAPFRIDAQKGADFLITFANHAWFKGSSAAAKHLEVSRLRAIETGRPLVFVSNRGESAVISAKGKILESSHTDISMTLDIKRIHTPYHQWPHWVLGFCIVLLGCRGIRFSS